jgi:hypothetical protein
MAWKYKCSHATAELGNNDHNIDTRDKLECGESVISVGRHFHSESSVRTIEQTQAANRFSVEAGMLKSAEVAYKIHESLGEKVKKTLPLWI